MLEIAIDNACDEDRKLSYARIGHVYCVGYGNYVKIGHTANKIEFRLKSLQTASPEKLQVYALVVGSRETERSLHRRFSELRLQGEWFRREGAVTEWIDAGCPL